MLDEKEIQKKCDKTPLIVKRRIVLQPGLPLPDKRRCNNIKIGWLNLVDTDSVNAPKLDRIYGNTEKRSLGTDYDEVKKNPD